MANLVMAVSPTNLLRLTDVVIYRNFCCHFKARLDYEGDRPCIQIQGERYSLVNSAAVEERGGEREQPRDLEQAQHGQKHMGSNNKQMSTFGRHFRKLGVKLAPAVSITNMCNLVQRGESCGPKEKEIPTAVVQPGKILGPGKDKPSKLRQDEEWSRIPDSCCIKTIPSLQASKEWGPSPPLSLNPMISLSNKSAKDPRRKAKHNKDAN